MSCELITPGPVQGIGLFAVDECYQPVYGADAGYFDSCATVGKIDPQTDVSRPEFAKYCPNGDIRAFVPERKVTKTTDVAFNFPWLPAEWLGVVGAVTPVIFKGETVGYSDCDEAINLIAVVWQELLGNDACAGGDTGAESVATVYVLRDVSIGSDGDMGTSGFNYTLAGSTVAANIGSGPIPLFFDSDNPDAGAWPDDCLEVCRKGTPFKAFGPPDECGVIDTVEPDDPCTPVS